LPHRVRWAVRLVLAGCVVAGASRAGELDPWRLGCPDCTEIPVPAALKTELEAFERARQRQNWPVDLVGPACRRLGEKNGLAEICAFETTTTCGSFDLAVVDGTLLTIRFASRLSELLQCRRSDLADLRTAVIAAFLHCGSAKAKRRATRKLLADPVDLTTPSGIARFERDATENSRTGKPPSFDIGPICGTMHGFRSVVREKDAILERISLMRRALKSLAFRHSGAAPAVTGIREG
jgi:hypothetical protein